MKTFSALKIVTIVFILGALYSCATLNNNSSKYNFSDGYYYSKLNKNKSAKYYVVTGGDSINLQTVDQEIQLLSIKVFANSSDYGFINRLLLRRTLAGIFHNST